VSDVELHWAEDVGRHTRSVARKLLKAMVVPLLGAGVNVCGRPDGFAWRQGEQQYLPTGGELAAYLAREFEAPDELVRENDLLRVSQFIDAIDRSGGELYQTLHEIFDADYAPGPVHTFLARLAPLLREREESLQVILTTNYDDALERAFEAAGEPYDLITYIVSSPREFRGRFMHWAPGEQPRVIESANDDRGLDLSKRTVILKLHGAVDRLASYKEDNYVITEDHYIDYLTHTDITSLLPPAVTSRLRNSHFLFLGYSMRDWNLRVILRRIWGGQALEYGSWAIQKNPDEMEAAVWEKRNVEILDLDLEEYIAHLSTALEERIESETVS